MFIKRILPRSKIPYQISEYGVLDSRRITSLADVPWKLHTKYSISDRPWKSGSGNIFSEPMMKTRTVSKTSEEVILQEEAIFDFGVIRKREFNLQT